MSFPKQAVVATLVVGAAVGGLVLLGRNGKNGATADAPHGAPSPSADTGAAQPNPQPAVPPNLNTPGAHARALVLPEAWLVADLKGDLTGRTPFAGQPGMCATVPAPERVALAVLAPKSTQSLAVMISARSVHEEFWGCVRDQIVRAGGTALAQNDRYEVLKSPTGVVALGPNRSMIFLTDEAYLERALAVIAGLEPGAATEGPHAGLYGRLHPAGETAKDSLVDVTLSLSENWLSSVGQDAEKSPLRFVHSAFLGVHADGSAGGGVQCDEEGCAEVLAFLERAVRDLSTQLPPDLSATVQSSLVARHAKGTGRITLEWKPDKVGLGALLGRFLGEGSLF